MNDSTRSHPAECVRCLPRLADRLPWLLAISGALIGFSILYTVITHSA